MAIRRRLTTGKNFDLVAGIDMDCPQNQQDFLRYLRDHKVLVVTLAPNCRSFGPTSYLNKQINHDTWFDHYAKDRVHAEFCGRVAQEQMKQGRYFFGEQPHPTTLWQECPWSQIVQHPDVIRKVVDQCMLGTNGTERAIGKETDCLDQQLEDNYGTVRRVTM